MPATDADPRLPPSAPDGEAAPPPILAPDGSVLAADPADEAHVFTQWAADEAPAAPPTPPEVEARALEALVLGEEGDPGGAAWDLLAALRELGEHTALVDALAALGDQPAQREPHPGGEALVQAMIAAVDQLRSPTHQITVLLALAELETTQRQPAWAAWWLKRALAADVADMRPWDSLDLLLDAFPDLPVDRRTRKQLRQLREAFQPSRG